MKSSRAVVVRRTGSQLAADDVQAWAATALAPFKVPVHVEFRDHLPRNAMGKVMKRHLESDEGGNVAED